MEPQTAHLTVGEAADELGVSPHTLRYYETAGVLSPVPRDPAGRRLYDQDALAAIRFVLRLRGTGMPIEQIKRYADLVRAGEGTARARLDVLEGHRDGLVRSLAEQAGHLAQIELKIQHYRTHLKTEQHPRQTG